MAKQGKTINEEDIQEIMQSHDITGDHQLSIDEFKKMMLGNL